MPLARFPRFSRLSLSAIAVLSVLLLSGFLSAGRADAGLTYPPPKGKTFLGVTDTGDAANFRDFAQSIGKHPPVIQTFHPWGNSLHQAMPRWKSVRARPMLHITTRADDGTELITPRQIAKGRGDDYLLRLNSALDRKRIITYLRPLGEPNRCLNAYAVVDCSGNERGGSYSHRWYKSAFRRIAIIVRGGEKRGTLNRRLDDIGLPKIQKLRKKKDLPRRLPTAPVAIVWSPLPDGSPNVNANEPRYFWPGKDWVDWVGTDFYSRYGNWKHLKKFYSVFAKGKNKPFALTEWGLWGEDQPKYVKKVFRFMKQRDYADMLIYYQDFGSSNEFRIQNFPRSKKALKKKISSDRFPKFAEKYPRFR